MTFYLFFLNILHDGILSPIHFYCVGYMKLIGMLLCLDNPFGDGFIKLEIDQQKFNTNKTAPSVHHIPLGKRVYRRNTFEPAGLII